jgi:hypothetical protein
VADAEAVAFAPTHRPRIDDAHIGVLVGTVADQPRHYDDVEPR